MAGSLDHDEDEDDRYDAYVDGVLVRVDDPEEEGDGAEDGDGEKLQEDAEGAVTVEPRELAGLGRLILPDWRIRYWSV
jgi:hypothetical protein